jgi:hypothetical protein
MTSVELSADIKAGLDAIRERDGIPQSEAIRRALRMWLEEKGISLGSTRKARAK